MSNTEIAKKVIDAIGGVENVSSVAHCATRLRVMVKDESKINKDVVENIMEDACADHIGALPELDAKMR